MITEAADRGDLTNLGRFAGSMPVDLNLTRLVAYGIALGIKEEAIVLAAALSLPRSPFRIANPLIHTNPDEYNYIVRITFMGNHTFDNGTYSQPIMLLRMLIVWRSLSDSEKSLYVQKYGIVYNNMKQFDLTAKHLAEKVESSLSPDIFKNNQNRKLKLPDDQTILLLRLLLTWTADGNIIRMKPMEENSKSRRNIAVINSPHLTDDHIKPLFPDCVDWELETYGKRIYTGILNNRWLEASNHSLLVELCTIANSIGVPVVWVQQKIVVNDEQKKNKKKDKKKNKEDEKEKEDGANYNETLVIAVQNNDDYKKNMSLLSVFRSGRLEQCGFVSNELNFVFFLCFSPTKTESKHLNNLRESFSSSISLVCYSPNLNIIMNFIILKYIHL